MISDRMLRLPDVLAILPVGRSTFYAMVAGGIAPQPIKVGTMSMWPESEIAAMVERLKSARQASQPTAP